jgi:hypothetical protein
LEKLWENQEDGKIAGDRLAGPVDQEKKPPHAPPKAGRAKETVSHAKARRGKAGLGFVFFAASRAAETVRHAKARRREEGRPG